MDSDSETESYIAEIANNGRTGRCEVQGLKSYEA